MARCQNCGAEVSGSYCPNCGFFGPGNYDYDLTILKNVDVKPRYTFWTILLAGWLGWGGIFTTLIGGIYGLTMLSEDITSTLMCLPFVLIGLGIIALAYLPGIKMIRKRTPKELVKKTTKSFVIRALTFMFCWGVSLAGVFYIIGIFLKSWRLGLWASRPKWEEYTAFYNGRMIPVTKYEDDLPLEYGPKGEYIYMDADGVFYRPPVK